MELSRSVTTSPLCHWIPGSDSLVQTPRACPAPLKWSRCGRRSTPRWKPTRSRSTPSSRGGEYPLCPRAELTPARKIRNTKTNHRPGSPRCRTAAFGMATDPSHPGTSPPSAGCRAAMPRSGPGAAGCSRSILGGVGKDERAALPASLNQHGRGAP